LHQPLVVVWLLQEQLDNRCKDLQLGLSELFHESFHESGKNLISIADLLGILPNNPDQSTSSIWLVQLVDIFAQSWDDAFITWVFAEDVLDDYNCLLNNIVDLGGNEIQ
jgi:hypothetical protein